MSTTTYRTQDLPRLARDARRHAAEAAERARRAPVSERPFALAVAEAAERHAAHLESLAR